MHFQGWGEGKVLGSFLVSSIAMLKLLLLWLRVGVGVIIDMGENTASPCLHCSLPGMLLYWHFLQWSD